MPMVKKGDNTVTWVGSQSPMDVNSNDKLSGVLVPDRRKVKFESTLMYYDCIHNFEGQENRPVK